MYDWKKIALKKNSINRILIYFLFLHVFIWTVAPTVSNTNLPLDTIEALSWGNELQLGYDKYPPIFPLFTELFFKIFGNQDWSFYLLSQLFVASSFLIIFIFSKNFLDNEILSLISVMLLETIYFFNYTTPELNAFLCQFPFLAITVLYCWKAINEKNDLNWAIFGIFAGLSTLIYYLSLYLLAALGLYFVYRIFEEKKFNYKYILALFFYFIVLSPHLYWIFSNNFETIKYALFRSFGDPLSGFGFFGLVDHFLYPLIFLAKQAAILTPFFLILRLLVPTFKMKLNFKDQKLLFLFCITILPIILMFLTSLFFGIRIRTMWMTTFYLFPGVFFIYLFKKTVSLNKLKKFVNIFLLLFIILPSAYVTQSFFQKDKRTDYPGREIAFKVQKEWNKYFTNPIDIVVGEGWVYGGWYAGNLSYHLKDRPKLRNEFKKYNNKGTIWLKPLNKMNDCEGKLYQVKPYYDICMLKK